jgi:tRNA A37 threonylcarbamoyltransferase TsaD
MLNQDNFDFSFSGLKTAVLNIVNESIYSSSASVAEKQQKVEKSQVLDSPAKSGVARTIRTKLAFELQEAITDVLVFKTLKAAKKYQVKSILVGGGVAANSRLREKFQLKAKSSSFDRLRMTLSKVEVSKLNAQSSMLKAIFSQVFCLALDFFLKFQRGLVLRPASLI